jgi:hypothetical protein
VYFEVSADHEPVVAESVTAANDDSSVTATVPHLVRTLFDLPEAEAPAARMAQPLAPSEGVPSRQPIEDHQRADAHDGPAVAPLTWVTLAAGAALLGTGVGFGISANNAFDDFKHRDVRTGDDVTRAHSEFDSAKARGTVANVLIPAGGAVLGVGAVLLFLDLSKGAPGGAALNVIPVHGGALATARRTFGGL